MFGLEKSQIFVFRANFICGLFQFRAFCIWVILNLYFGVKCFYLKYIKGHLFIFKLRVFFCWGGKTSGFLALSNKIRGVFLDWAV